MKKQPTPRDVRDAYAFLHRRGINKKMIPPTMFAATSKKLGKSFDETIKLLIQLLQGDQGKGQSPIASRIAGIEK